MADEITQRGDSDFGNTTAGCSKIFTNLEDKIKQLVDLGMKKAECSKMFTNL